MSRNHRRGSAGGGIGTLIFLLIIFRPLRSLLGLAIAGGIAFGVGKLISEMAKGLDLRTHNKQDEVRRELDNIPKTENTETNSTIDQGQQIIRQIRAENDAIPDPDITQKLNDLERKCIQVFRTVADKPEKSSDIRKFMNYYLPTTLKMVHNYRVMQDSGVSSSEMREARKALLRGLDMVMTATQKQIDNLFKTEMLDVSTDIDVLEKMLVRDGLMSTDTAPYPEEAPSHTSSRTYTTPTSDGAYVPNYPILKVEEDEREQESGKRGGSFYAR